MENWEEVEKKKCNLFAETGGSRLLAIEGSSVDARNVEEHHGWFPEERKGKSRRLRKERERERVLVSERCDVYL